MSSIIQVENLSKKYIIGHQQLKGKKTLRDSISQNIASLGSKFKQPFSKNISANSPYEEFWALKDINFEVEQGDRIGIIGRNGAGKSTLLKVLSRITEPTGGKITIKGRVASLLEVGTGFNGELSGRENIFLNGAILGMHRTEIKQKFDEIVDFSGVERFLDTPVKRYSSGMYVRLAFAVAAHLEPEILIVDEVLAVGDAEFQKKCLGKMQDVSQKEGRTVLFVSHNMAAIQNLCNRIIVLNKGQLLTNSEVKTGIEYYLNSLQASLTKKNIEDISFSGNGAIKIKAFYLVNEQNIVLENVHSGDNFFLVFEYAINKLIEIDGFVLGFSIHSIDGATLSVNYSDYQGKTLKPSDEGIIRCKITRFPFTPGRYFIAVRIISKGLEVYYPNDPIGIIDVETGYFHKNSTNYHGGIGKFFLDIDWQ